MRPTPYNTSMGVIYINKVSVFDFNKHEIISDYLNLFNEIARSYQAGYVIFLYFIYYFSSDCFM